MYELSEAGIPTSSQDQTDDEEAFAKQDPYYEEEDSASDGEHGEASDEAKGEASDGAQGEADEAKGDASDGAQGEASEDFQGGDDAVQMDTMSEDDAGSEDSDEADDGKKQARGQYNLISFKLSVVQDFTRKGAEMESFVQNATVRITVSNLQKWIVQAKVEQWEDLMSRCPTKHE